MEKTRILIVEDEILVALGLKMVLEGAGHSICGTAVSGEDAIAAAARDRPDVILMDIRLLGAMDGVEAAQRIAAFLPARVVFVTGYDDPGLKERALLVHPLAILSKPVERNLLIELLEEV
jgi:DNA-binding NarL/FixJ family response regulator